MKKVVLCLLLLPIALSAFTQDFRIALSDFVVHSENPRYTHTGKGISELIAVELRRSPGITLIEREKRTRLLEEMAVSLSDMADPELQVEVGRLLVAAYMVFGEIIDMEGEAIISLRMIDVASGQVVWNEKLVEKLSNYEHISGFFARSVLDHLGVEVASSTVVKAEERVAKDEEALFAFSRAVDHYDNRDTEAAKRELDRARKIDPRNEAVRVYLGKLVTNTTKFKVKTEPYFSYQNPAFLGILRTDMLHVSWSWPLLPVMIDAIPAMDGVNLAQVDAVTGFAEVDISSHLGYAFPLGRRWGMRVDTLLFFRGDFKYEYDGDDWYHNDDAKTRGGMGAIVDLGYRLNENMALGLGAVAYPSTTVDGPPWQTVRYADRAVLGANAGFLYMRSDEGFIFDTRLGFSDETYDIVDPASFTVVERVNVPLFWENTATFAFNERRSFFIVKQLNDISFDRSYYYGRILPALEHFPATWFSARLGAEGALVLFNDTLDFGYGILGGLTFRIPRSHLDFDLNVTYRMRPSRSVEELLYPDLLVLFNLTVNDLFVSRE